MMGHEHYREAERLIDLAHDTADQGNQERADFILARAQVHATLAMTVATLQAQYGDVNTEPPRPDSA